MYSPEGRRYSRRGVDAALGGGYTTRNGDSTSRPSARKDGS